MKENVVAFIVARLSSSRLPAKHLRKIGDRKLIDWTIEKVKESKLVEKIVIATTDEEDNKPLIDIAKEHGIDIFLYDGDINDVVGRLTKAAKVHEADIPILISGDCPLIYAKSLDKLIKKIEENKELDSVGFCIKEGKPAIHEGMVVYRKKCWIIADKLSDKPNLREHQFPVVGMFKDKFRVGCILDDDIFYKIKHRISVDTLADLEFMNAVYDELKKRNMVFDLKNMVKLLLEKPELMKINSDVHQIKLEEKQKKALFILKNEENLETFFKMAYELTKMGIGVRFYSDNKKLSTTIEQQGFGVINKIDKNKFDFTVTDK